MRTISINWMVGLVAVIAVCLGLLAALLDPIIENDLCVENRSGQMLSHIRIDISTSKEVELYELPDGEWTTEKFHIGKVGLGKEVRFTVTGSLADGTKIRKRDFSYVAYAKNYECASFTVGRGGSVRFIRPDE